MPQCKYLPDLTQGKYCYYGGSYDYVNPYGVPQHGEDYEIVYWSPKENSWMRTYKHDYAVKNPDGSIDSEEHEQDTIKLGCGAEFQIKCPHYDS